LEERVRYKIGGDNMNRLLVVFIIGIILISAINAFHITKARADIRSRYMDLGDSYLKEADNNWNFACKQALAVQALAAYTAAQKE